MFAFPKKREITTMNLAKRRQDFREQATVPLTVEEGCVFVLGDNRDNSRDSRWPGMAQIPCEDIIAGKILIAF